uniref:Uncharacterized protein n=1 Tax=Anas zonorhyncha TaxID=75864 RepID=A0A8B9ZU63_9AVES
MGWVSRGQGRGLPRAWAGHPARLQPGSGVLGNPSPATAEALHAFPLLPGDGASLTLCPTAPALCSDIPSPWDGTWHAGSRCVGVPPAGMVLFSIPATVNVLGFKAGGIAAGSVAATMMSVAAKANNGGVAAGSTVAVLQSIGKFLVLGLAAVHPCHGVGDQSSWARAAPCLGWAPSEASAGLWCAGEPVTSHC